MKNGKNIEVDYKKLIFANLLIKHRILYLEI